MLTIDVSHPPVTEAFAALQAKLDDLPRMLDEIGYTLENVVQARFDTQSDPLGRPWAPWKPSTVKGYPKDGNRRVLDRYGENGMLGSLNYQADASNSSVRVGFGVKYAACHEWGTKHMERRRMLTANPDTGELAPDDTALVMDILHRHLFI